MLKDNTVDRMFMIMFTLNGMCLGVALCMLLQEIAR